MFTVNAEESENNIGDSGNKINVVEMNNIMTFRFGA